MFTYYICITLLITCAAYANRANVCKSFGDYETIGNNKNCYYNPEFDMTIAEIISHHGYPFEEYEVETNDGYLVTMHRLPRNNPKGVVFFAPPALSSSIGLVDKGPSNSLGFMLWDAGFDVWLGNYRGNMYGRKHQHLNPDTNKEFWNFSFHEIGIYDYPAQLEFVANKTGAFPRKIIYIGYSMGATSGFIYGSLLSEHAEKFNKVMLLIGGTSMTKHLNMQAVLLPSLLVDVLASVGEMLNFNEIFGYNSILRQLTMPCQTAPFMAICIIPELVAGYTIEDIPPMWIPVRFAHGPDGISYKILLHYLQLIKYKKFRYFDFGPAKNMLKYNSTMPPEYPLGNFITPALVMSGGFDKICTHEDMKEVYTQLSPHAQRYGVVCLKNVSHSGFFYGLAAKEYAYKPIIRFLDELCTSENEVKELHIPC